MEVDSRKGEIRIAALIWQLDPERIQHIAQHQSLLLPPTFSAASTYIFSFSFQNSAFDSQKPCLASLELQNIGKYVLYSS